MESSVAWIVGCHRAWSGHQTKFYPCVVSNRMSALNAIEKSAFFPGWKVLLPLAKEGEMSIRNLLREANFLELRRDLSSPSEFGSYNHSDVQHPVTHHRGSEGSHYPPFIRNR